MTRRWQDYTLLIALGLMLAYLFVRMIYPDCGWACFPAHQEIISGQALAPYRYRVLTPYIVEALARLGSGNPELINAGAYSIAHAVVMPAMLVLMYRWLQRVGAATPMVGALALAAYMPLGYILYNSVSLYTMVEIVTVLLALLLLWSRSRLKLPLYVVLTMLATANRETGLALALLYAAAQWRQPGALRQSLIVALAGGSTYAALRFGLGNVEHVTDIPYLLGVNLGQYLGINILHNGLLLPVLLGAATGWRRADARLKRLALVLLPYAGLVLLYGQWFEVRLWFPTFPVLFALGADLK